MSKEAMKLALEAINNLITSSHATDPQHWRDARQDAVTALAAIDKALAEQPAPVQQEPVAWMTQARNFVHLMEFTEAEAKLYGWKAVYTTPQPAQQKRGVWPCVIAEADFEHDTITLEMQCSDYKVGAGQHWLSTSPPAQRKPLTDEQVNLFINGRGDEGDDDYVEPTGDGFGLTDADLVRLVRRVEAAHGIKGAA